MSGTKGMTHYSLEIKLQAIQLHEIEELTYAQVIKQLGMCKAEQIEVWVQRYREEGEVGLSKKGSG